MKRIVVILSLVALAFTTVADNIPASPMPSPQIEDVAQKDRGPVIHIDGCTIELKVVDGPAVKFEIFSITGQLIKAVTVKNTPIKVELPKGFYLVKCAEWTRRVMLKG